METESFADGNHQYAVIFDTAGAIDFKQARGALTEKGRYMTLIFNSRVLVQSIATSMGTGPRVKLGVAIGTTKTWKSCTSSSKKA